MSVATKDAPATPTTEGLEMLIPPRLLADRSMLELREPLNALLPLASREEAPTSRVDAPGFRDELPASRVEAPRSRLPAAPVDAPGRWPLMEFPAPARS